MNLSSTLKMEAECYSKMFITIHKTAWCQNPKDLHINFIAVKASYLTGQFVGFIFLGR
jgi:hypothetical protein